MPSSVSLTCISCSLAFFLSFLALFLARASETWSSALGGFGPSAFGRAAVLRSSKPGAVQALASAVFNEIETELWKWTCFYSLSLVASR